MRASIYFYLLFTYLLPFFCIIATMNSNLQAVGGGGKGFAEDTVHSRAKLVKHRQHVYSTSYKRCHNNNKRGRWKWNNSPLSLRSFLFLVTFISALCFFLFSLFYFYVSWICSFNTWWWDFFIENNFKILLKFSDCKK